jgi:hypothetical protein
MLPEVTWTNYHTHHDNHPFHVTRNLYHAVVVPTYARQHYISNILPDMSRDKHQGNDVNQSNRRSCEPYPAIECDR